MDNHYTKLKKSTAEPFWRSRTGISFIGFLAIALFFLVTEHRAHLYGVLPWLLLLLCPLMHVFGHKGNHSHHEGKGKKP